MRQRKKPDAKGMGLQAAKAHAVALGCVGA
jgi:hypothetical protein